jgi:hypothetical protein
MPCCSVQLLLAGLAALPLQARRMLPETLLSLLQCRDRQDQQLAPDIDDRLPGGHLDQACCYLVNNHHPESLLINACDWI